MTRGGNRTSYGAFGLSGGRGRRSQEDNDCGANKSYAYRV
jgi:hypothetical protein